MPFLAPSSLDIGKIAAAGKAGGWSPSAMNSAVGHYGSFDFQRSRDTAGNTTFYTQYQVVSNVAVGAYLYGTGIPEILSNAIEDTFAASMSSNGGDSNQLLGMGRCGWPNLDFMRRDVSMKRQMVNMALLACNIVGIFFYIRNATLAWAIPAEKGLQPAIAGAAMVWGMAALPWALAFLLIDGTWWYVASSRKLGKVVVLSASIAWAIAIAIDFYHH
jgi:hypothetical protein